MLNSKFILISHFLCVYKQTNIGLDLIVISLLPNSEKLVLLIVPVFYIEAVLL